MRFYHYSCGISNRYFIIYNFSIIPICYFYTMSFFKKSYNIIITYNNTKEKQDVLVKVNYPYERETRKKATL